MWKAETFFGWCHGASSPDDHAAERGADQEAEVRADVHEEPRILARGQEVALWTCEECKC
jgi:hypothetical protein